MTMTGEESNNNKDYKTHLSLSSHLCKKKKKKKKNIIEAVVIMTSTFKNLVKNLKNKIRVEILCGGFV